MIQYQCPGKIYEAYSTPFGWLINTNVEVRRGTAYRAECYRIFQDGLKRVGLGMVCITTRTNVISLSYNGYARYFKDDGTFTKSHERGCLVYENDNYSYRIILPIEEPLSNYCGIAKNEVGVIVMHRKKKNNFLFKIPDFFALNWPDSEAATTNCIYVVPSYDELTLMIYQQYTKNLAIIDNILVE